MPAIGRILLRSVYEVLYHQLAWCYDGVSWIVSGGRWSSWQRAVEPFLVGPRILDVGCGTGRLLRSLLVASYDAHGMDRSIEMRGQATKRLRRAGFTGRIVGADACALPFAVGSFDTIVATFPAEFVRETAFWREASRVIRPGGRIVILEGASVEGSLWPGILECIVNRLGGTGSPPDSPAVSAARGLPKIAGCGWTTRQVTVNTPAGTVFLTIGESERRSVEGQENSALTDSSQ